LFDAYSNGRSLGLIVHEISILGQEHGKHTSSHDVGRPENERIVSAAQLAKLEDLGLKRIREAAGGGSVLLEDPLLGAILHRWREWGSGEEAASWVAGVVVDDDGLIRFLERSLVEGWSSQEGRTYDVDPTSIGVFVDPATLVDRVRSLVGRAELTSRQAKSLDAFLRHYQQSAPVAKSGTLTA
jgi:predicted KAP-like P-loop ATPase